MDAHAHLLSLGWAGPGHSLDSKPYKQKGHRGLAYDPAKVGNNGNGLVKPLFISQRQGRFGIGKKAHEPQAGNEWWLKGFESALGNIGKNESERSSGTSTPVARESAGKHGGLYSFFIKGQEMQGTIGKVEENKTSSKKWKTDVLYEKIGDDTSGAVRRESTAEFEQAGAFFVLRDKDEERRHRTKKPNSVEEFLQASEYLEARTEKKKKKKRKSEAVDSEVSTPLKTDQAGEDNLEHVKTKEEKREWRRKRREKKQKSRTTLADLENG